MGWNSDPGGLYDLLTSLHRRYPELPLAITENGAAFPDQVSQDASGQPVIHDQERIDYIARHLAAIRRAMTEGTPVTGYFCWSLLDNFEWAEGYSQRFGLIGMDYPTGGRIWKDSASWYQAQIRACRS